ncbi:spore germination protein [Paenisporosarcina cavernae]|uniref:Spore germination protein n=1 Tax=Paenisporosarcina cavernae TaxID=2320858 RepID=A0A385YUJ0_9BACL|nr:spore germination protein [Paenisporosarcina cavernae]AYC29348.1 spore germination protein [Paenisporosarcina cavernae]
MTNRLFEQLDDAEQFFKKTFPSESCFDVGMKKIQLWNTPALIVYVTGFIDSAVLTQLLTNITASPNESDTFSSLDDRLTKSLPFHSLQTYTTREEWLTAILSGPLGIVLSTGQAYTIDVRNYPGRQPEEPDNEKVIRGSRDGFTENILQNATLVRRRIRDPQLRLEKYQVSKRGKVDVAFCYLEDIANPEILTFLRERIQQVDHDGLTMTDKSLEELLFKQSYYPMPFARYTERADTCAAHLLEGHIAIIVDTSPSVLLVPTTLIHHLQHAEEYRQAPSVGTIVHFLRFTGFFMSFLLIPIWYLLTSNAESLPDALSFIGPKESSKIPVFLQLILGDVGLEYLRLAAIHTPTPLSTAMGLVAAIIIGQIAIDVGLFQPEVILYLAVSAIFTYSIPSYELSVVVKMIRVILLLACVIFGAPGLFLLLTILYLHFVYLKPLNVPYLWPIVPFFPKALFRVIVRQPLAVNALRPYIVHAKNRSRSS